MNVDDLKQQLSSWGPVTVLLIIGCTIAAIGGLIVSIVQPATLPFDQYLSDMEKFALALAGLGIGRGVMHVGKGLQANQSDDALDRQLSREAGMPPVPSSAELDAYEGDGDEGMGADSVPDDLDAVPPEGAVTGKPGFKAPDQSKAAQG